MILINWWLLVIVILDLIVNDLSKIAASSFVSTALCWYCNTIRCDTVSCSMDTWCCILFARHDLGIISLWIIVLTCLPLISVNMLSINYSHNACIEYLVIWWLEFNPSLSISLAADSPIEAFSNSLMWVTNHIQLAAWVILFLLSIFSFVALRYPVRNLRSSLERHNSLRHCCSNTNKILLNKLLLSFINAIPPTSPLVLLQPRINIAPRLILINSASGFRFSNNHATKLVCLLGKLWLCNNESWLLPVSCRWCGVTRKMLVIRKV